MKILVTGGAGFIGSHIVEHFHELAEVIVLDNLQTGNSDNLVGLNCRFLHSSILDRDLVRQAMEGVDYVFHLAAMISVPESMEKPIACTEINTLGTLTVLEEAAKARVKKLIFSSSAAIYGENPITPKVETLSPDPRSPYAISKLEGEYYCKLFSDTGRLPTTCLRYFNVFGPRQDPKSQYAAAVPIFIHHAIRDEPITIFGNGEQTRDFIYVKDVVAANSFFATQSQATGVFNVAYGQRMSINDLAVTICGLTGATAKIIYAPQRAGDVKHSMASIEKLLTAGFTPNGSFLDGLKTTVALFKEVEP